MGRSRKGLLEEIFELLLVVPWWWSPVASLVAFIGIGTILPATMPLDNPFFAGLKAALPNLAWLFAILFLLPAPFAYLNGLKRRKQLDAQTGLNSIKRLSWRQFEELVAEAYYRKGYRVKENVSPGPDGGVDIWLTKDGERKIVQCKHWKTRKIGVPIVREMYGVMVSEGADSLAVVSSGNFTAEARKFSKGKPIELVDGTELAALVRDVRTIMHKNDEGGGSKQAPGLPQANQSKTLTCPKCGSDLVTRVAKRGGNTGQQFLGCAKFPKCRYTRSL